MDKLTTEELMLLSQATAEFALRAEEDAELAELAAQAWNVVEKLDAEIDARP